MRSRVKLVTLAVVLVPLAACTMLSGVDGLRVGDPDDASSKPDAPIDGASLHDAAGDASVGVDPDGGADTGAPVDAAIVDARADADAMVVGVETCTNEVLVGGNLETGSQSDELSNLSTDTYGYTVTKSGLAKCAWIYLEKLPAKGVHLGVYFDATSAPAKLAAKAFIAAPALGWNSVKLDVPLDIETGETYWLGVTPLEGVMAIRNHGNDACGALHLVSGPATSTDVPDPYPSHPDQYPNYCDALIFLSATTIE